MDAGSPLGSTSTMGPARSRGSASLRWGIVAVFLVASLAAAGLLLNRPAVHEWLAQRLKQETGIEVATLRLRLFPRLAVEFSELILRDERRPGPILRVRQGSFTLRVLPLLSKRLAVVHVVAVGPEVVIRRDREGRWHLPLAGGAPAAQDDKGGVEVQWLLPDLQVTGGDILIADEQGREAPHELRVRNVQAMLDSDLLRREADLTLTGDIDDAGAQGGLRVEGALSLAAPAVSAATSGDGPPPVRFVGSVKVDRFDLAPWIGATESREGWPWRVDAAAQVSVAPGASGYEVALSQAEARLAWLVIRGQGGIQGLGSAHPAYSAGISTSPISLADTVAHLPTAWLEPAARARIEAYGLAGTLELLSGSVTGRFDQPEGMQWKGVVKVTGGGGSLGGEGISMQNLSGTVFFDRTHVEAVDLSGFIGPIRLVSGKLALSHLEEAPVLDLDVRAAGSVTDLLDLAGANDGSSGDAAWRRELAEPGGEVRLSVHAAGPLAPTPHMDVIEAEVTGHDLHARLPAWNAAVEHLEGTVVITPRSVELRRVTGSLGPARFDAQGAIELGSVVRSDNLTVRWSTDGAALQTFLESRGLRAAGARLAGPITATLLLSGTTTAPAWKGAIDMTQAEMTMPPAVHKPRGVPLSLDVEGTIEKRNRLSLSRLALWSPPARLEGRAVIELGSPPAFEVGLNAGPLAISQIENLVTTGPLSDGRLTASLKIAGKGMDWSAWKISGLVDVRDSAIAVEGLPDRVRDIALRLHLTGRDALIESMTGKFGDSDLTVRGTIRRWAGSPVARLTIESSKLDIARLIPDSTDPEERARKVESLKRWAASHQADVTMMIRRAQYHRLALTALSGHLRIGGGAMELDHLVGETAEGSMTGRVVATLGPGRSIKLEGRMEATGVPVTQALSLVDPEAEILTGTLTVKGVMQAMVHPSSLSFSAVRSAGPLQLRIDRGRIVKGRVIPKVIKVLNVPALLKGKVDFEQEGFPFEHIRATVEVKDGALSSQDMVLDSPILKISGAGRYDWNTDQLDLGLAVNPLGSYSDVLKNIPLFGRILAGDRPGLTTALFEVKGVWSDPDVRYLPIESLAKGLTGYPRLAIDVLRNILSLPTELLSSPRGDSPDRSAVK